MKNRRVWLLFLLPLIVPVALLFRNAGRPCSSKIDVSIGNYSSLAAGQHAALQQLSYEIKRCPKAQTYTIRRNNSGFKYLDEANYEVTVYSRKDGFLQDGAPVFGAHTQWLKVTDQAIHKVAASSGNFKDLAKNGCQYAMP
ncbi:MAG TPA: hypothetical protein VF600_08825 [Abditibacteriaceae bacterium]|jgi:hypothetical protein